MGDCETRCLHLRTEKNFYWQWQCPCTWGVVLRDAQPKSDVFVPFPDLTRRNLIHIVYYLFLYHLFILFSFTTTHAETHTHTHTHTHKN